MKIKLTTIYVDDQDKALRFYTQVAGFVKKTCVWITKEARPGAMWPCMAM